MFFWRLQKRLTSSCPPFVTTISRFPGLLHSNTPRSWGGRGRREGGKEREIASEGGREGAREGERERGREGGGKDEGREGESEKERKEGREERGSEGGKEGERSRGSEYEIEGKIIDKNKS